MTPELMFQICTYAVLPGWALLALAPRWRLTQLLVHAIWIPSLLALAYIWAALAGPGAPDGAGFGSLEAVILLYSEPHLMLAGWIHFLAFDLFIGAWQVRDAARHDINHWLLIPCLALTLLFGPTGLLLYFGLRFVLRRSTAVAES
jgi:hypothetical protein